jgi:hypothetical protein
VGSEERQALLLAEKAWLAKLPKPCRISKSSNTTATKRNLR